MADKTFKVKPGEEIDIFIRRRRQDAERIIPYKKKRGIIDPFSRDEFLPRRLSSASYIRFFDLGQLAGEVFVDNPHTITPGVVYDSLSSNFDVAGTGPTEADYRAREAIFVDNLATIEEDYRELKPTSATPLNIGILGDDGLGGNTTLAYLIATEPRFTNQGLSLSPTVLANSRFGVGSPVYNYSFRVAGEFKNHITATYDPEASAAAFTPTNTDVYYLLPSLYFVFASNSDGAGVEHAQYLNYFYRSVPRAPLVDPLNEFYPFSVPGSKQWFKVNANPALTTLAAYNSALTAAQIARGLPGARLYDVTGSGSSYAWTPGVNPVNYDNPAYSSLYPIYPDGSFAQSSFNILARPDEFRILLAIIRQGENYFYVWSNID